jgi:transcriptional regulator with XRE-family HTH domain
MKREEILRSPPAGEPASNPAGDLPRTMQPADGKDTRDAQPRKKLSGSRGFPRRIRPANATSTAFVTGRPRGNRVGGAAAHASYVAAWSQPYMQIRQADGEEFFQLRRHVLQLSRADVARLLRVAKNTVWDWETGRTRLPFCAFFALRLIAESLRFRLASEAWRDWELDERCVVSGSTERREATYLRNKRSGACFEPDDLENLYLVMQRVQQLDDTNHELKASVEALTRENTELRELFLSDGVTSQLHDVRDQVQALYDRINTATVHQLHKKKVAA